MMELSAGDGVEEPVGDGGVASAMIESITCAAVGLGGAATGCVGAIEFPALLRDALGPNETTHTP